jgi:hypothetical protein
MIKLRIPSGPTDFEGLRRLIALKMSNSLMGGKCKKSLDNEKEWGGSRCSIIVNGLEVFSKSFGYLSGFSYTGTVYVNMNSL